VLALASPALAHGDHDARPLLRGAEAGPYVVSLWQVYPDVGSALTPRLIIMVDGTDSSALVSGVDVEVNSVSTGTIPSPTSPGGWETIDGITPGDVIGVTISDGSGTWPLEPVIVPPAPTAMLPMKQMIAVSIFLATATAWWIAGRTARAWRRPLIQDMAGN
jgi:hypothetical protein